MSDRPRTASPLLLFPVLFLLFGMILIGLVVASGAHDLATLLFASQLFGSPVVYLATTVGFFVGLDRLLTQGVMVAVLVVHYALLGLGCGYYFRNRSFNGLRDSLKVALKAFFVTWALMLPMAAGFGFMLLMSGS